MKKLPARGWDWPTAAILLILITTAAARLWVTDWTPHLGQVQTVAALGCVLGLALGYSSFQRWHVWLIAMGYSSIILPWQWLQVIESRESLWSRLASVGGRLSSAFEEMVTRQPVGDYIFFIALMTLLFWSFGLFSGYQLARKGNLLAAILPAGLGLVIIELYDFMAPERILYLGLYLLLSLILLGRDNLIKNNAAWRALNIATSSDTSLDISTGIVVASLALLIGIWLMPFNGFTLAPVARAWRSIDTSLESTRAWIKDTLAAIENYIPVGSEIGFGAEMSLGRTAAQGENILFNVNAPAGLTPRYYWRARVYDTYTNGRWSNGSSSNRAFSPDEDGGFLSQAPGLEPTTLVFGVNHPQNLILTVNAPLWASRDGTATFGHLDQTSADLLSLRARNTLRRGERYEVQSAVRSPTILALRAAGTDYPDWLKERYLQLPANFPARIKKLAEEITANAATPYDQAAAITSYLRSTITYTETITSNDPLGGDPIAWMLFNSQEGFCNYYASAEVLMLRALGIPARLAVGYAQGKILTTTTFEVHNKDAHAWPEVYFPGQGWVEFEPTSAQPTLSRPSGESIPSSPGRLLRPTPSLDDNAGHEPLEDESDGPLATSAQTSLRLFRWVIIFIVTGLAVALLIYLNRRTPFSVRVPRALARLFARTQLSVPPWLQNWLRWTEQTPAERAFETINRCLWILGKPQPIHATPNERAAALSSLLPEAASAIEQLTQQHIGALFSPVTSSTRRAWQITLSIYFLTLRRYFRLVR